MNMARFLLRRVVRGSFTLILLTLIVYGGLALLPGDPIRALFGQERPDPEIFQAMRDQYHLNEPWIVQYWIFLQNMVTGDLGSSYPGIVRGVATVGPPVTSLLEPALPVTARLLVPVLVIQILGGAAAGAFSAAYRNQPAGAAVYASAVAILGIPVVVLAYFLQTTFGFQLNWLPVAGLSEWPTYVLPVASLSLGTAALVILMTRSQLQDVLGLPFIKAASSRGLRKRRLVGVHALRVALGPVITLVAANLGQLITALIIVETIYGIPGVGSLLYRAIFQRDRSLLIGLLMVTTAFVIMANIVADAAHMLLDPRTQEERQEG